MSWECPGQCREGEVRIEEGGEEVLRCMLGHLSIPLQKQERSGKVSEDCIEIMVVYVEIEIGCSSRGEMTYVVPPSLPINLHINPRSRLQDLPYIPTTYFRLQIFGDEDMVYSRESCSLYVDHFQLDGFESVRVGG
jgi:hypothetical protein